jgi:hypothetical protein
VREAVNSENSKLWKKAMVEEMDSLDKSEALYLVKFPTGRKAISSKWVFKKKLNAKGKVEKYKDRLVEKGYSRVEGIDFGEMFSHFSKLTSIIFIFFYCFLFLF